MSDTRRNVRRNVIYESNDHRVRKLGTKLPSDRKEKGKDEMCRFSL